MELTGIAREDYKSKDLICDNKIKMTHTDPSKRGGNGIPDVYGMLIGRKNLKTGETASYWKADIENKSTEELDKILNNANVYEKRRSIRDYNTLETYDAIDYFLLYDVAESSKNKPTVTKDYVIGCANGHWDCEYEILFTCGEDNTRRIVIEQHTVNMGLVDFISELEDEIQDAMHGSKDTEFKNIFKRDDDGIANILMYNEIGEACDIEIDNVSDAVNMIVSVRCIKCDFVNEEEKKSK